ncbi:MAG: peptide MFS transporter [Phocaeicola sp.]|uniref:peptide MFS transporter n=1 Tax=Phocaeicola sp. TaxID=2773926 RepID=UPI003F9FFC3C
MFEGQPKGLFALALSNTGERFGYYTMIAVFALFLRANFGLSAGAAGLIYSLFLAFVYLSPIVGGILADKYGYGKMVTLGIVVMLFGYLLLSIPLGGNTFALIFMLAALLLIGVGTGLYKGNVQVMAGNLYDDPKLAGKRDAGFSVFYMAVNIGALFAPTAAVRVKEWAENSLGFSSNDAYHFAFAVACLSMVVSIIIYYAFRYTFRHVEGSVQSSAETASYTAELSLKETKSRIFALCFVFAVVIFFWMSYNQNGLTLTYFADEFTQKTSYGLQSMWFDVVNLVMIIFIVYATFSLFQSKTKRARYIALGVIIFAMAVLIYKYTQANQVIDISAPIFQQFGAFFVVALTPVSLAIFGALAKKDKEPSAPRKIAYGMLVASLAYVVMLIASFGLNTPDQQKLAGDDGTFVSANWLIVNYLIITFAELLLSPMGISFVSKVSPPKYKGLMMGGWFVSTALGNILVNVGGFLWGSYPLWFVWMVFIVFCVISALFMFAMMKRLEKMAE